jgi:hypothetical protein
MTPDRASQRRLRSSHASLGVGLLCLGLAGLPAPPAGARSANGDELAGIARTITQLEAACTPAKLYVWTGPIAPNIELQITGNDGTETVTFASGSTVADIVNAINTWGPVTGVNAAPYKGDQVQLSSQQDGPSAFVLARQLSGEPARLHRTPFSGGGKDMELLATGEAALPADLSCDFTVDSLDFLQVLREWGPCAELSPCPGDLDGNGVVGNEDVLIVIDSWTQP